jgi:hypothetical protein
MHVIRVFRPAPLNVSRIAWVLAKRQGNRILADDPMG